MKVLHVPYTFYPDPCGGTEVYVEALSRHLQQLRIDAIVAAPGTQDTCYDHRGLRVRRYGVPPVKDLRVLYGEGDPIATDGFNRILAVEHPDVVHLHAFTSGVSLAMVRAAKRRGGHVIFTYHTPTVTCQRGTMMQWDQKPCDGLMELHNCTQCTLQALFSDYRRSDTSNVRKTSARVLARLSAFLSRYFGPWVAQPNLQGGAWTALRMMELITLRHTVARSLFAEVDHVVAVSQWVKDTLIRNGVSEERIALSRQGVAEQPYPVVSRLNKMRSHHRPLSIAFLGRLDSTKGVDLLIEAIRAIVGAPLRLDIFGLAQDKVGMQYNRYLQRLASMDERVQFRSPVPVSDVIPTLRNYDLLAVPSQWLETGPLVVLEAFAAGIPVIGSRRGGIAEIVRDGVDGILIEADDVPAWSSVLLRLSSDRSLIHALRRNIQPPRTMAEAAREMATLYRQVLNRNTDQVSSAMASSL